MREMDHNNNYRIARVFISNDTRREPEYWNPRRVNAGDVTIKFGHRVPE